MFYGNDLITLLFSSQNDLLELLVMLSQGKIFMILYGNFLFNDFRPPTPLFKIAQNSIALNTMSYDVAS